MPKTSLPESFNVQLLRHGYPEKIIEELWKGYDPQEKNETARAYLVLGTTLPFFSNYLRSMAKWKILTTTSTTMPSGYFMSTNRVKTPAFWIALLLILFTPILMYAVYADILQLHVYVGPYYIHHWLSWTGATLIALYTPIYYSLKRRNPQRIKTLLGVHVFGNLLAFMFISIHFTQQISRPAQFYPDLGTGIVLYATMLLMVATGFSMRFQIGNTARKTLRFIHTSATVTFYLIILVHILHGLGIL